MDLGAVKRFFYWDVKTWMIVFLGVILSYSMSGLATATERRFYAANVLTSVIVCISLSLLVRLFIKKKEFKLSKDAAITGMIIAIVLQPIGILLTAIVAALAIILKNLIRFEGKPLFNPAALALVLGAMLLKTPLTWWAAGPLSLLGFWIAYRQGKVPMSLSFISVSLGLNILLELKQGAFSWDILANNPAFFLAFFMLTEPKTTPLWKNQQLLFGAGVAILAFLHALVLPTIDPLLVGLLIMNALRPMVEKWVR